MISKGEAAMLLTAINSHHGNAQWDDMQLDSFHRELDPRNSLQDMRTAVIRFYSTQTDKWMRAADINRICRRMRAERTPSEHEIQQLAAEHDVQADDYWAFRRRVIFGTAKEALTIGDAVSKALAEHDRPRLASKPAPPHDRRTQSGMSSIGSLFPTL